MADTIVLDGDILIEQEFDGEPEAIIAAGPWKFLYRTEVQVTTDDTTAARITDLTIPAEIYDHNKIIYVRIRDKAGKRNGYFFGTDNVFFNAPDANGQTSAITHAGRFVYRVNDDGTFSSYMPGTTTGYGVYAYNLTAANKIGINRRYHATYSPIIDGTYSVEVYALVPPKPIFTI